MARKPAQQTSRVGRRLRLESLENRSLLTAAFAVNLYEDVNGVPGNLIANDTIQVGQSFFTEIMADEYDPRTSGLARVALDISWDPSVLTYADDVFDPSQIITSNLPTFQTGVLDVSAGRIDDLGGSAFVGAGRDIGNLAPERFALLHFTAISVSNGSPISMGVGRSRIVTNPTSTLSYRNIQFETQAVFVTADSNATPAIPPAIDNPTAPIPDTSQPVDQSPSDSTLPSPSASLSPVSPPANTVSTAQRGLQVNLSRDAVGVAGSLSITPSAATTKASTVSAILESTELSLDAAEAAASANKKQQRMSANQLRTSAKSVVNNSSRHGLQNRQEREVLIDEDLVSVLASAQHTVAKNNPSRRQSRDRFVAR